MIILRVIITRMIILRVNTHMIQMTLAVAPTVLLLLDCSTGFMVPSILGMYNLKIRISTNVIITKEYGHKICWGTICPGLGRKVSHHYNTI